MLYNNGTIAINGNTATGTGTNWTTPASQVRAGQTIIVLSNPVQMFQISSVNSATSLTVTPAASPALSGQKYGILVSDIISVDGLAQAMSQLINEYDENIGAWETFVTTSANQSITVTINGVALSIPGIGKLLQKGINGALSVEQGGTGDTTKEGARTNLGLGSAATRNAQSSLIDTTSGAMLQVNSFGLGATNSNILSNANLAPATGFWGGSGQANTNFFDPYAPLLHMYRSPTTYTQIQVGMDARLAVRAFNGTSMAGWRVFWSDGNTTVDSNGFIKRASPIIKLFGDGSYETNDESDGCTVRRIQTGEYLIEGCQGLNSDAAWGGIDGGFEIPSDRNKQPLVWLDYEVNPDGSVLVKTYHRTYPDSPAFALNRIGYKNDDGDFIETIANGQPVDIPSDQFVSVRVEMPGDSIWNVRQRELEKVMEAERAAAEAAAAAENSPLKTR